MEASDSTGKNDSNRQEENVSVEKIRIKFSGGGSSSRNGSPSIVVPKVVYTPPPAPAIFIRKPPPAAVYKKKHFVERDPEVKAVGQMCFLAPPSPFIGKGILKNKLPSSRPSSANSYRPDDPYSSLQKSRHMFIRHFNKSIKSALYATNTFQVINSNGDCIFLATESSSVLKSFCLCRGARTFSLQLMTPKRKNLLQIHGRPGCFATVTVTNSENQLIGTIRQNNEMCTTKYSVYNSDNVEILKIVGMEGANCCCAWASCEDVDFQICLPDGVTPIGRISREWDYSVEDICGALVSLRVDIKTKSLILAAVFLIDFSFYEGREDGCWFSRCFLTLLLFVLFTGLLWIIVDK
ncbi:unnamed protein product [Orchesella dallaii]|uniref:Phospholipid scramblase n=1 Tax=Orchesella dallaii TaxID=48710 RepID=A0ABP1Q8A8_9HEXA